MRETRWNVGWDHYDANFGMVNLLLMGDSWDANTGLGRTVGLSSYSGSGRMRVHYPSSLDLEGPWGWGERGILIQQGEVWSWPVGSPGPEPAAVTDWKWAALWQEEDLNNVADIDFYVVDTCSTPYLVAADITIALRAKFRLQGAAVAGHCLEMWAHGYAVPFGGVKLFSADYYHSGDPSFH